MRRRAMALLVTTTLLGAAPPSAVLAQSSDSSEAARHEARERFDRGLELFNDGDNPGALAEFKRAFELIPNSVVLYNIGLV
jgi:Flp pilus assembly protein TadD